jgi:hypothetical protein
MSRISRSIKGEMALISLGIHASMSRKEDAGRLPANRSRKSGRPFVVCIRVMSNALRWEKCTAGAKTRKVSRVAELIDLYWDAEPRERSLDHAATVALPPAWQAARFGAQRKRAGGGNILDKV